MPYLPLEEEPERLLDGEELLELEPRLVELALLLPEALELRLGRPTLLPRLPLLEDELLLGRPTLPERPDS